MEQERKLHYDRRDILGDGGFGVVFKGNFDGVDVAIKRIELARLRSTTFTDREIKYQREMNHPNVVKLLHVEEDENFL